MGMTTSSQTFTRTMPGIVPAATAQARDGVVARVSAAVAAMRCQLRGHSPALCVDEQRVYLACPECQLESPGWVLDGRAPRPRFEGAPDRRERYAWITGQP